MSAKPQARQADEGTIIIVSNRGPHNFVREEGRWVAKPATSGLASMIEPLARQPNVAWFCCVSEPPGSEAERDALFTTAKDQTDPDLNVVPVPLPAAIYHDYYGEISNEVLWMLQHGLVGEFGFAAIDERRHLAWEHYLEANRRMAEAIVATELPVRAFLIEDYHLYPLTALLRERYAETPSLHFLHVPFPDPAVLKLVPPRWRESILRGLLGANVVGLQTAANVRSFLACCQELLGSTVDYDRNVVIMPGRTVRVRAFPASVDPSALQTLQNSDAVAEARQRLAVEKRELNVIRVDRIEPTKNQVVGFMAFGRMLDQHPELVGRVRFLAFLIPSRTDSTIYRDYYDAVFQAIKQINDRFAPACGFEPIKVFYTNDRPLAFAAMESCDVLLVNSRQDGMNLIAKEWAVLAKKPGALLVSETAGVAAEARESATLLSPLDLEGTARALADALVMPETERSARLERFRSSISKWTTRTWLDAQLQELGLPPLPKLRVSASPPRGPTEGQGGAIEQELMVRNRQGIHARPAAAFVRCAREFESSVEIVKEGQTFSAKSILAVLTANLNTGSSFILRAEGVDAPDAITRIAELLLELNKDDP
jgi:trehalose 6-phosphate synthase